MYPFNPSQARVNKGLCPEGVHTGPHGGNEPKVKQPNLHSWQYYTLFNCHFPVTKHFKNTNTYRG
jgi:hypothetical protein